MFRQGPAQPRFLDPVNESNRHPASGSQMRRVALRLLHVIRCERPAPKVNGPAGTEGVLRPESAIAAAQALNLE